MNAVLPRPDLLYAAALIWIVFAALYYVFDLSGQFSVGWTNGAGRPLGDDFINYWSGAVIAWREGALAVYDWMGFHAFEQRTLGGAIDFYHYSYPPILLVLTAPLAALAYLPALGVWLVGGWYAFYRALRLVLPGRAGLLAALAAPAVFVNAIGGQNGTWTAALMGGGLGLVERQPVVAGVLLGLLSYKPQLGVLVPVALLAGRQWKAFAAGVTTVVVCAAASVVLFGWDSWLVYLEHADTLRIVILEDGTGVWHRMVSVFVAARRLGADVPVAYAVQGTMALIGAGVVAYAWARGASAPVRNALVGMGACIATPYLQDYDLVVGMFVAVWLVSIGTAAPRLRVAALISAALMVALPCVAAPLAKATGLAFGPLFILPGFVVATLALVGESRESRAAG